MKLLPRGIIPPMITPFDDQEKVDCQALQKMTDYLIKAGVHGVFPLGSTGEGYGIDFEEKKKVIETVMEATNKKVPVYAGTGAITTKEAVKLTKMATEVGVDALSVITPYFISPDEEELFLYFQEIAANTDLPIILYNNPGRTGVDMSTDLIIRLSQIDNIVGIKDSSGDMSKAAEIIRRSGEDFAVLAGRDTLIYGFLAYGGHGSVAATANIVPELVVSIYELFKKGDYKASLEAQFRLAPLRIAFSLGSFPVIMKESLQIKGVVAGNTLKPIQPLTTEAREKLKEILHKIG